MEYTLPLTRWAPAGQLIPASQITALAEWGFSSILVPHLQLIRNEAGHVARACTSSRYVSAPLKDRRRNDVCERLTDFGCIL